MHANTKTLIYLLGPEHRYGLQQRDVGLLPRAGAPQMQAPLQQPITVFKGKPTLCFHCTPYN